MTRRKNKLYIKGLHPPMRLSNPGSSSFLKPLRAPQQQFTPTLPKTLQTLRTPLGSNVPQSLDPPNIIPDGSHGFRDSHISPKTGCQSPALPPRSGRAASGQQDPMPRARTILVQYNNVSFASRCATDGTRFWVPVCPGPSS